MVINLTPIVIPSAKNNHMIHLDVNRLEQCSFQQTIFLLAVTQQDGREKKFYVDRQLSLPQSTHLAIKYHCILFFLTRTHSPPHSTGYIIQSFIQSQHTAQNLGALSNTQSSSSDPYVAPYSLVTYELKDKFSSFHTLTCNIQCCSKDRIITIKTTTGKREQWETHGVPDPKP